MFVPQRIFFTKGVGIHKDRLASFELSLRKAGIEKCNLVYVSSIFPPGCKRIPTEEGLKLLSAGQITFAVMARNATNEPNRLIAASIGVATPADTSQYGYLSEHHPYGETDEKAGEYAESLRGHHAGPLSRDRVRPDAAWEEREKGSRCRGRSSAPNVTQSAVGDKHALWCTVIAVSVLLV